MVASDERMRGDAISRGAVAIVVDDESRPESQDEGSLTQAETSQRQGYVRRKASLAARSHVNLICHRRIDERTRRHPGGSGKNCQ